MSRKDKFTGNISATGNNRSKALNITKRAGHFNLQKITFVTKDGKKISIKTSAKNIRTLKNKGYLVK